MLDALRAQKPSALPILFPKDRLPLHAMLTSVGYDRCCDPSYDWDGTRRGASAFVLLQHTISGSGRLRFQRARMVVEPGQTMLLRFPHDNRYWLGRGDTWEFFWICLNGREVLRLWGRLMSLHGPLVRLQTATIEHLAGNILRVQEGGASTAADASAIAYDTAMALVGDLAGRPAASNDGKHPVVPLIEAVCRSRLSDPALDVAALADVAGLSRTHFTRIFTDSMGTPPARYLMHVRMNRAVRLLSDGAIPVKQVAAQSGFADANYFAKAFRHRFGVSPSEVRRSGAFLERDSRPAEAWKRRGSGPQPR